MFADRFKNKFFIKREQGPEVDDLHLPGNFLAAAFDQYTMP